MSTILLAELNSGLGPPKFKAVLFPVPRKPINIEKYIMIIHEIGSAYFIQFKVIPGPKFFAGNPNLRSCSLLIPSLSTFLIKAIKFGSSKVHPSNQAYIFGCVLQLKL